MMNKGIVVFLLSVLGLAYWLAPEYLAGREAALTLQAPTSCRLQTSECQIRLPGDIPVTIRAEGEIKPLSEFKLFVNSQEVLPKAVSFEMVDMDMGINRYQFSVGQMKEWETKVVLPVCTSNRSDWIALFDFKLETGEMYRLEYPFQAAGHS